MASVNKWIGIGNLGADPESRVTASGEAVCNISIACTETWRDKATGEKKEMTEWVRVGFFGKLAEIAGQYLRKGSQVYVEGSLRTRKWQDKEGKDRYTTDLIVGEMQMLSGKPSGDQESGRPAPVSSTQPATTSKPGTGQGFDNFDNDLIPF